MSDKPFFDTNVIPHTPLEAAKTILRGQVACETLLAAE